MFHTQASLEFHDGASSLFFFSFFLFRKLWVHVLQRGKKTLLIVLDYYLSGTFYNLKIKIDTGKPELVPQFPGRRIRSAGPLFGAKVIGADLYMPVLLSLLRRFAIMAEGQVRAYTAGTASMAFVTVPNIEVGKKIAGELVKNRLAACVNIIPQVTSVYEWEGKIEEDSELILMIKTLTAKMDEVSEFVRKNHPYDCAEVISSQIDNGNAPYLQWISDTVLKTPEGQK